MTCYRTRATRNNWFLKLSLNSDHSFNVKPEPKEAVNCLLEGRDVLCCNVDWFRQEFYLPTVPDGNRTKHFAGVQIRDTLGKTGGVYKYNTDVHTTFFSSI